MNEIKEFMCKMVEAKGGSKRLKLQDFEAEPFKGIYLGKKKGLYSENLVFIPLDDQQKTVEICGVNDLLNKMENVPLYSLCEIRFDGSKTMANGKEFLKARVFYCEMIQDSEGNLTPKE